MKCKSPINEKMSKYFEFKTAQPGKISYLNAVAKGLNYLLIILPALII